ncbi:hypothetical protein MLD38_005213 [Melastoma candidum]|uniref:Uncharacterized protein n=1 Tax=Melastoma candidum TaxID=119954 RepID=A0ACB9S7N2_9MYRT|nr:hypothetical protein MLD38_005213 [Melastoma candidum]
MQLSQLSELDLSHNMLTGYIDLSANGFSSIIFPEPTANVSHINGLGLGSCNLTEIPQILKNQESEWNWLDLSNNNISGQIPEWVLQRTLYTLDLSFNNFHGTLPTLQATIQIYLVSNNRLSGEIPSSICEMENLQALDLADNNFTGVLPPCFGNHSSRFSAFSLSGNNFIGKIPEFNKDRCRLTAVDLSSNSFEGSLPRSLMNCSGMTSLLVPRFY